MYICFSLSFDVQKSIIGYRVLVMAKALSSVSVYHNDRLYKYSLRRMMLGFFYSGRYFLKKYSDLFNIATVFSKYYSSIHNLTH